MQLGQPIGVNFIVGSATTYKHKPPSYEVVYLDPETLLPVDHETWAMDLDESNLKDTPIWELKYTYKDSYGLKDLSPESFWWYA